MSLALLFPGQGAQRPGMLGTLPASRVVRRTLAEAEHQLSGPVAEGEELLCDTVSAQLALLTCGVAAARCLAEDYGIVADYVAGHSVGAFAAAVSAGVLTFDEALMAVRRRAELMRQAGHSRQWGMAAVSGLRLPKVDALIHRVATRDDPLWLAAVNAADQAIVAGTRAALGRTRDEACRDGALRFELLPVVVASHGDLHAVAVSALDEFFATLPTRPQRAAYITNVTARCVRGNAAAVLHDLAHGVAAPVQWYDSTRLLAELGVTVAVELPPAGALTRLLSRAAPRIRGVTARGPELSASRIKALQD